MGVYGGILWFGWSSPYLGLLVSYCYKNAIITSNPKFSVVYYENIYFFFWLRGLQIGYSSAWLGSGLYTESHLLLYFFIMEAAATQGTFISWRLTWSARTEVNHLALWRPWVMSHMLTFHGPKQVTWLNSKSLGAGKYTFSTLLTSTVSLLAEKGVKNQEQSPNLAHWGRSRVISGGEQHRKMLTT